jgi:hypothetical protein
MKLLTVIKNGKFTGTQYEQDSDAIRAHHASQGETLVFLDYRLTANEDGDYGVPSVGEISQALITQLTAARKEQERQGVTINGIRYAGDPGNRQALREAIAFKDYAGLTEFESWKDSDNVFHANHPLVDVVDAYQAIGARRAQLIATEGEYAAQIIAGTLTDLTETEVVWP